jgi:hypothetical protein
LQKAARGLWQPSKAWDQHGDTQGRSIISRWLTSKNSVTLMALNVAKGQL